MLRRAGSLLAEKLKRWIPDAFVFAIGLTLLVGMSAWGLTESTMGQVLNAWYDGFWILLEFGMQVVLVLATGYAIALSPPASRWIDRVAQRINSPAQVYFAIMLLGAGLTLVSWGWMVLVAVLARELATRVRGLDYAYLTACVYLSSWPWVCGLSSSIPLLLNTEGNFLIETGVLDAKIPIGATLGSRLNLIYFGVGLLVFPALMVAMRPRATDATPIHDMADADASPKPLSVTEEAERLRLPGRAVSDTLNHGWPMQMLLVALGFVYLLRYFGERGFDLNLEIIIFAFLMVGLAAHRTPMRYVMAMKRACGNVSGIIFQYPFYAGIMGLMMFTGLGSLISDWMAASATPLTLPAVAQLAAAVVNFAIPSAGGEWAVIGPAFVETAQTLSADLPPHQGQELIARIALAVAYGETSTNLLQPFFLLIILPVMGPGVKIQARDVMGYMVLPFVVTYLITAALVTWAPM